jgi:hypothetical protein
LILAHWDWRMIFWINAGAALLLGVLIRILGGRPAVSHRVPLWWRVSTIALSIVAALLMWLTLDRPAGLVDSVRWGAPFVNYGSTNGPLATQIGVLALALTALALIGSARFWGPLLRRIDLFGALLLVLAIASLILTFAAANPEKQVIGPLGYVLLPVGLLAVLSYLWWHRRATDPLIPRGVLTGRVRPALICSCCVGVSIVALVVDIPVLARLTITDSQTEAALILVRFLVAVPIGALLGGRLLQRLGPGQIAAPGLLMAAAGLADMATWGSGSLEQTLWVTVVLAVVGLGVGLAIAPVNDAALFDAPHDTHGVVSSVVVVARMIGMVAGLALLTGIGLHRFYARLGAIASPTGADVRAAGIVQVQTVFLGASVAALLAAVLALGLGRRRLDVHT